MEKTDTHIELLNRFINGKTTPEEEQMLLEWLHNSDYKERIMNFYTLKWEKTSGKRLPIEVQIRIFRKIKKQIRQRKITHNLWKWISYTAVAVFCITLGIGTHWFYTQKASTSNLLEYVVSADNGQRASIKLPDGTKIWLNSHSKLYYNSDYGVKERIVFLSGEAYFEVSKDTLHRFLVNAGDMKIEALGTSFNVKAYEEDNELITTLFEGCVRTAVGKKICDFIT